MQGFHPYLTLTDGGGVRLELTTTANTSPLAIDVAESTEMRIRRLTSENPVVVFSRSSCCMCHAMKKLLSTIGVHPTVIELEDDEITALPPAPPQDSDCVDGPINTVPAVFMRGKRVGGLESLVALHLSGHLVPMLVESGALWP